MQTGNVFLIILKISLNLFEVFRFEIPLFRSTKTKRPNWVCLVTKCRNLNCRVKSVFVEWLLIQLTPCKFTCKCELNSKSYKWSVCYRSLHKWFNFLITYSKKLINSGSLDGNAICVYFGICSSWFRHDQISSGFKSKWPWSSSDKKNKLIACDQYFYTKKLIYYNFSP